MNRTISKQQCSTSSSQETIQHSLFFVSSGSALASKSANIAESASSQSSSCRQGRPGYQFRRQLDLETSSRRSTGWSTAQDSFYSLTTGSSQCSKAIATPTRTGPRRSPPFDSATGGSSEISPLFQIEPRTDAAE